MRKAEHGILYGLPVLKPGYDEARLQLFPHAGPLFGGCVVRAESPKTAAVYRCLKCEEAERF